MLARIKVAFVWRPVLAFAILLIMLYGEFTEGYYKVCEPRSKVISIQTKRSGTTSVCKGCKDLENCTTVIGSVNLKGISVKNNDTMRKLVRFPYLREITGHLIVTFLEDAGSLSDILPNLSVIHGQAADLFQDYSLVVYFNNGLRSLGLNSLTVVKQGGIKIESNPNLCYVNRVRWKSLMNHGLEANKYDLAIQEGNSRDCFDKCVNCDTPSGHGSSGITYCWGGTKENCQRLCHSKCGSSGCASHSSKDCCHEECLGGCSKAGSSQHCHACQHFRLKDGSCVKKCPPGLKEVKEFHCFPSCPRDTVDHDGKCVKDCPAGYRIVNASVNVCVKCLTSSCPRVCDSAKMIGLFTPVFKINLLSDSAKLRGCTRIVGGLEIEMTSVRGGTNIAQSLSRDLGSIEEVKGHVVVRQSNSLISLNFFKNLKKIDSNRPFSGRYALAIFDNPNLESLWDFHPNFTIVKHGVFVQLNPQLCLHNVYPLIDNVLKWNRNDSKVTISKTTNGNARTCDVHLVNITITEGNKCKGVCVVVSWPNKVEDHRNVVLYSIWYRETTSQDISEYDDIDACSSDHVWKRKDLYVSKTTNEAGKRTSLTVYRLNAYTLYAFRLEAFVISDKGVKSAITYYRTKQTKPSLPLSLQVNFLSSDSLQVTWLRPFFPNGNITHYIVRYHESNSSYPWGKDFDWCKNQASSALRSSDQQQKTDKGETDGGSCAANITCDCEKDGDNGDKKELEPFKKAAQFSIQFQDRILGTVFTKKDKDGDKKPTRKPVSTVATTLPQVNGSVSTSIPPHCGNGSKNSSCATPAFPPNTRGPTTGSNKISTSLPPSDPRVSEKNTTNQTIVLPGLKYFTEYHVEVCACNSGAGCGTNEGFTRQCAEAVGRTDKNVTADDVGHTLHVTVNNKTKTFTLTWKPPEKPNGVVLRYDIHLQNDNETAEIECALSSSTTYTKKRASFGQYAAKVRAITPVGNGSWSNIVTFVIADQAEWPAIRSGEEGVKLAAIVGISLAAIVVVMVVFAVFMYFYMHKRFQKAKETGVIYASVNPEYMNCSEVYVADEWEVAREKIKLIRELGNGSFGMVYEGEAKDILPGEQCCRVAVKTVCDTASLRDRVEFLKEASVMKAFNCNHVVRLLGVVSAGQPVLVVMELMENGDLKSFLRRRRPDGSEEPTMPPPTDEELYRMAAEIADGMAYLADRKFVHRDLAARNCMVSGSFTCKIGDFGMARDVYETDYYRKGGKGFLPVRWMAPESLKDGVFTSASDVWSFGVVLWEMATLAEQPYQGKSNEEVMKFVIDGGIMDAPEGCPVILFDLMMSCWQHKHKLRPVFTSIVAELDDFVSSSFIERSFYHNRIEREDTASSYVSTMTDKEDSPDMRNHVGVPEISDPRARESVV